MPRWVINFKTITDFAATTCELYFLEFLSGHDWAHLKVPKVRFFNGFFCLHLQANIYVTIVRVFCRLKKIAQVWDKFFWVNMAWTGTAESCGDSITELFKHLCTLHCNKHNGRVPLHRPKAVKATTPRQALRTLYDVLFEYHLGDLKEE